MPPYPAARAGCDDLIAAFEADRRAAAVAAKSAAKTAKEKAALRPLQPGSKKSAAAAASSSNIELVLGKKFENEKIYYEVC